MLNSTVPTQLAESYANNYYTLLSLSRFNSINCVPASAISNQIKYNHLISEVVFSSRTNINTHTLTYRQNVVKM